MFIAATMIPGAVLFIRKVYTSLRNLGLGQYLSGYGPRPMVLMTPFAVFYLRQVFLATPRDVEEAARIDGASYFSIFFKMILPMHSGLLDAFLLAILVTVGTWNEFFLALPHWARGEGSGDCGGHQRFSAPSSNPVLRIGPGLMACTVLGMIPMIALMVFFGRKVVESFQFSGGQ